MNFLLSGFSVSSNIKVQNAIITATKAIDLAYKEMTTIKRTNTPTATYTRFFGDFDSNRADHIWQVMNMLQYATGASFIRYNRNFGRAGTYAAAQRPAKSGWSEKSVKQILDKGEFTMKIDDAFYGANSNKWEQAQTIVHELSHLVGNTDDESCPWDNRDAYGIPRCRRLANQYPDLAKTNADSYGYYAMTVKDSLAPKKQEEEADMDLSALFG